MSTTLKKLFVAHGPYVEELRRRIIFLVLFFVTLFFFGFAFSATFIKGLVIFFGAPGVSYIVTSPFQAIALSVDIGLSIALIFFLPLLLAEIYEFVAPALTRKEKKMVIGYTILSMSLFIVGFCYGVAILHYAVETITSFNTGLGLENLWDVSTFFSQILLTSVLLGFLFQFPLVLWLLLRLGIVTIEFLAAQRRLVIASTVIIVALLPPTDGLSLLVMAAPLIGLFELVLLVGKRKTKTVSAPSAIYS